MLCVCRRSRNMLSLPSHMKHRICGWLVAVGRLRVAPTRHEMGWCSYIEWVDEVLVVAVSRQPHIRC